MSKKEAPEQWLLTSLGNIVEVNSGVGFPIQFQGKEKGDYPVYKVRDLSIAVTQEKGRLSSAGHYINKDEVKLLKGRVFRVGTTLFAKIGEAVKLNRRAFVERSGLADNNVMAVSSVKKEMDRFIFYFLNTIDLSEASRSTTVPSIRKSDIEGIPILLPSISEQKIIADKLDDLLARVESIKTRLENIPEILKKFRQSVLSAAVSGKLTEEWRRGDIFATVPGVLSNYVSIDIGHAFKSKDFTASGVKLLRGQNIEPGALKWNDTKFYPEEMLNDFSHLVIKAGDIILAMDRPIISTGLKLARATENDLPCVLVQRVARFKDFVNINPDFLFILLSDPSFANYIQPNQTGSDIPHISGKQILSYNVKIPSLDEQIEIIRRVEDLFNYIENIIKQTNNALLRINSLTQAILAKAFCGELTAQWREENPDLISGINSVEALLEKITAEKLAAGTIKKRAKKSSH